MKLVAIIATALFCATPLVALPRGQPEGTSLNPAQPRGVLFDPKDSPNPVHRRYAPCVCDGDDGEDCCDSSSVRRSVRKRQDECDPDVDDDCCDDDDEECDSASLRRRQDEECDPEDDPDCVCDDNGENCCDPTVDDCDDGDSSSVREKRGDGCDPFVEEDCLCDDSGENCCRSDDDSCTI
ncbi:hypothetical protein BFW01_g1495 [Lasiodiplodia theobromae]|nr:hypothetical protein BFW01_g1495 [Lasiodiplodia theobromae]